MMALIDINVTLAYTNINIKIEHKNKRNINKIHKRTYIIALFILLFIPRHLANRVV